MDLAALLGDNVTGVVASVIVAAVVYLLRSRAGESAKPAEEVATSLLGKLKSAASGNRLAFLSLIFTAWQNRDTLYAAAKKAASVVDEVASKKSPPSEPPKEPTA